MLSLEDGNYIFGMCTVGKYADACEERKIFMISTNKDFEGISSNGHPTTYYWSKGDTPPTNNVLNGAAGIEMDATTGTFTVYFFDKTSGTWVGGE